MRILPIVIACLVLMAACKSPVRHSDSSLDEERSMDGDTLVVHVRSGSVWGEERTWEVDLEIGVMEGTEEYMFGDVQCVTPDREDGVYVFDGTVPALRHYDNTGTFVKKLGGEGAGPGEYQDACLGIVVRSDGKIVMREPRGMRLNVYQPDGEPLEEWKLNSGLFTANATNPGPGDHLYLTTMLGRPIRGEKWKFGYLHLDENGILVDTLNFPDHRLAPDSPEGSFGKRESIAWSPKGYFIVGVNDPYTFNILNEEAYVRVKKDYDPIKLDPAEWAAHESFSQWYKERFARNITYEVQPVSRTKAAYSNIAVGSNGWIWVKLYGQGVKLREKKEDDAESGRPDINWGELHATYDVFEENGTYLGGAIMPEGVEIHAFDGETLWGTSTGEFGETKVVRLTPQSVE